MAGFIIALFTVILLLICGFMTVIILMQRASANAGMGTALGGGAAESVFGGETANVLLKNTIVVAVLFFTLSFLLYLGVLGTATARSAGGLTLEQLQIAIPPATDAPAGLMLPPGAPGAPATTGVPAAGAPQLPQLPPSPPLGAPVSAEAAAPIAPASANVEAPSPAPAPTPSASATPPTANPVNAPAAAAATPQ